MGDYVEVENDMKKARLYPQENTLAIFQFFRLLSAQI